MATVPDHSTFSKNRHGRFRDSDLLRKVFETTVRRCMAEGLVGGEGFAVDASLIKADANRQRSAAGRARLTGEASPGRADRCGSISTVLDEAAWGAASRDGAEVHLAGRSGRAMDRRAKGHAFFAYATNYLIDLKHAVIVDVEATRAIRQAEVGAARTMIDRTQERFGLWPERLAADSAYGSAENLAWLVHERGIEPHIPVFDKSERTRRHLQPPDFTYDHERDCYVCPAGKELGNGKKSIECRAHSSMRRDDALSRQQAGLRELFVEAAMLSERYPFAESRLPGSCEWLKVGLSPRGVVIGSVHKLGYGHKFGGASPAPVVA